MRLRGVTIDGDLNLEHLDWAGPLEFQECTIQGDVRMAHLRLQGRVRLVGSTVEMVTLNYAVINGGVQCSGLEARRGLFALGCEITGALTLQGAELSAPVEDERQNRAALDLYRAKVGDFYGGRIRLLGGLYAIGATFGRNVRLPGAEIWSRAELGLRQGPDSGDGLDLAAAHIDSTLYLFTSTSGPLVMHGGTIRLTNATCRNFRVSREQLVPGMQLEGFEYRVAGPVTEAELLDGLDAQEPAPRRAYAQLAILAASRGNSSIKKRAMLHQQHRLLTATPSWSSARLRHHLFGWLAGYGYAPGRALIWLIGCLVASTAVVRGMSRWIRLPSGETLTSWAQAAAFTVDQIAPFSASGYADQWTIAPHGAFAWAMLYSFDALKLAAWALAALALAAVTGLVRAE